MICWDDCDEAILGVVYDPAVSAWRVAYCGARLVQVFVDQGMDREGAAEWVEANLQGAYMGPDTPIIVAPADRDEIDALADEVGFEDEG